MNILGVIPMLLRKVLLTHIVVESIIRYILLGPDLTYIGLTEDKSKT